MVDQFFPASELFERLFYVYHGTQAGAEKSPSEKLPHIRSEGNPGQCQTMRTASGKFPMRLEIIRFDNHSIVGKGDSVEYRSIIESGREGGREMSSNALIAKLTKVAVLPPSRLGPRPHTPRALPHLQLDQLPPTGAMEELLNRSLEIPHVRSKQSRMASPRSSALYLADEFAGGPPEAFIDDHEFCHLHPLPEGSIHLTLPFILLEEVVRLGWGERHPIAKAGILTTLVTVYAPRDCQELTAVLGLIAQSCQFAQGKLQVLHRGQQCQPEAW